MQAQIRTYLGTMPHFRMLPETELDRLAGAADHQVLAEGSVLAHQAETLIQHIYVVRRGQFSIYNDNHGKPQLGGHIKAGEVFGGISLLMNAGVSLRTVQVDQETEAYLIPRETFLDLCARHKDFYSFFIENFSQHISDPALDTIIISGQAKLFLSSVEPFSMLPDDAMEQVSRELAMVFHKKGAILFSQGRTRVGHLYVLQKGSGERYFEQGGQKQMRDIMGEGDLYGGISMLLNDGLSVRTLEVTEDAYFYILPKAFFCSCAKTIPLSVSSSPTLSGNGCWIDPMRRSLPEQRLPPGRSCSCFISRFIKFAIVPRSSVPPTCPSSRWRYECARKIVLT
jgi:CBS domain-containing protein